MGKFDSTKTRVIPLMEYLGKSTEKLNRLFSLLDTNKIKKIDEDDSVIHINFGSNEIKLCPKQELLEWYVKNYDKLTKVENYGSSNKETQENRKAILEGSKEKIEEALKLIKENPTAQKQWYIFEGYTQPDIYIETSKSIYIGEAKRTEGELTTSTVWLDPRDQIIRHADSVIDKSKNVYYFFLIDEEKENIYELDRYGTNYQYYENSLPHRVNNKNDIQKLMAAYCGYTTWQKISSEFGINFPDTVNDIEK